MRRAICIAVFIFILLLFIPFIFYKNSKNRIEFVKNKTVENTIYPIFTREITRYPTRVEILERYEKRVGMEGGDWNLNFGVLPIGINGRRFIKLANHGNDVIKVRIVAYGNISAMIRFEKDEIKLYPGEEVEVAVLLDSSLSSPGNYTGEIDVISTKGRYSFLNPLIEWF